jgi:dinuclear metal center YbgI/SA1388 family protein
MTVHPLYPTEIARFLDAELEVKKFSDIALNGLQIEAIGTDVSTVALAVDSGLSVMQEAVSRGAQLLVVHHGVFWGKVEPLVGPWAKKASLCLSNGLSLYAAHLPLDGHPILGNAAQIATTVLNATDVEPDFAYHGNPVGVRARLRTPTDLDQIAQQLRLCDGVMTDPLVLPFGRTKIETVGIVTGSGSFAIPEVVRNGLDLLISGEPKQEAYHTARELACSAIFMGHYASETFGVRALQRVLESRFGVQSIWISEPTGI